MSFLTPQDRTLLLESLRPPADFQLDTAIGTTYSLDLIAMMVAPVGFTFFDVDPNAPDFLQNDPLEILEAIRRHASQIVLFCEAGRIAVPRHHRPLLTYLEERIVQAKAPSDGHSFHPKVWIIRYVNPEKDVAYRFLCLSRNLTFDRSWDTVLTLDGRLRNDRERGSAKTPTCGISLLRCQIWPSRKCLPVFSAKSPQWRKRSAASSGTYRTFPSIGSRFGRLGTLAGRPGLSKGELRDCLLYRHLSATVRSRSCVRREQITS